MILEVAPHRDRTTLTQECAVAAATMPSCARRVDKRLTHFAERPDLQDFLDIVSGCQALMSLTNQRHEATAAFIDKRKLLFSHL